MDTLYHPQAAAASPAPRGTAVDTKPSSPRGAHGTPTPIDFSQVGRDHLAGLARTMRNQGFEPEQIRLTVKSAAGFPVGPVVSDDLDGIVSAAMARPPIAIAFGQASEDGPTPEPRFRILTAQEMKALPPPAWLVDGLLVQNTLAGIVGEAATYKSFFALGIAFGVAAGLDVLGIPVHQGPVIYISAEGVAGIGRRVVALEVTHGVGAPDGLCFLPEAVQMLEAGDVAALLTAIAALPEKPILVVVDTLARCMAGGDENSAMDMGVFVRSVDEVRRATGACVLCLHHVTKATGQIRGSTALLGALDTLIEMKRSGAEVTASCGKQKDFEMFEPMVLMPRVLRFTDGQSSLALEANGDAGLTTAGLSRSQEVVGQALLNASADSASGITNKAWLNACPSDLVPESTYYRARRELAQGGYVEARQDGRSTRFLPTEKLTTTINPLPRDSHGSAPLSLLPLPHPVGMGVVVVGERERFDV